jgi:molecular chaperone GrpE
MFGKKKEDEIKKDNNKVDDQNTTDNFENNNQNEKNESYSETINISKSKIDEYENKIKENENLAKRIKADFENYKKCVDREKENTKIFASCSFIEKLLPVLDTFDQALINTKSETERKGLGLVYSQLLDILNREGLRHIECVGKEFNPYYHEIIMKVDSNENDNIILEEFQKGYMLNDKILRHSKVKVSKEIQNECKKEDNKDGTQEQNNN